MKERILFEQSLIDDAEISLGTAYQYLKISVYREEYRKRTLQTKYLHYLIESKGAENTENDNFISLIWKYKN